jgi:hypothetical protein
MTRRFLIFSFAVGLLALGGLNARAGTIPITVGNLEFSDLKVLSATPLPADLNVTPFGSTGITFSGSFTAPAGTPVDYSFSYVVTALSGSITGASLSGVYDTPTGTTGTVSVGESLLNPVTSASIGSLSISNPVVSDTTSFAGVSSILVEKDISVVGGSLGVGISIINQGYTVVPEPTSMALLGIGLSGLFTLRRFLKRTSVA